MTAQCPRCQQGMATEAFFNIESPTCPDCRGRWVPGRIVGAALGDDAVEFSKAPEAGDIDCPECSGLRMDRVCPKGLMSIFLDRCEQCHGVWFDASELDKTRRILERERLRRVAHSKREEEILDRHAGSYDGEPRFQNESEGYDHGELFCEGDFLSDIKKPLEFFQKKDTHFSLLMIMGFLTIIQFFPLGDFLASLLTLGFLVGTLEHAARGQIGFPNLDRYTDIWDFGSLFLRFLLAGLVCFGPLVFAIGSTGGFSLGAPLILLALLWLLASGPVCLVVLALGNRFRDLLNPLVYYQVIALHPRHFAISAASFVATSALTVVALTVLSLFGSSFIIWMIGEYITMALNLISFQILGVYLYAYNRR